MRSIRRTHNTQQLHYSISSDDVVAVYKRNTHYIINNNKRISV